MPPTSTRPMEFRAAAPAPVTRVSGKWPAMVAARGHQDRPQAGHGRLLHRLELGLALLLQLVGELDDQDAVLGDQADQGHQPDLANRC